MFRKMYSSIPKERNSYLVDIVKAYWDTSFRFKFHPNIN